MRIQIFLLLLLYPASYMYAQTAPSIDTSYAVNLKEVKVVAKWKNDTDRYHYNQMKYYVTTIMPYVIAASKLFNELNSKIEHDDLGRKQQKRFIRNREEEVRDNFEDKIKELNTTQGTLLIKLIARQTGANIYEMLQEFRNSFTALKWQAWARVNGLNLNKKYDPQQEPDLENIMDELGYPLPGSYSATVIH